MLWQNLGESILNENSAGSHNQTFLTWKKTSSTFVFRSNYVIQTLCICQYLKVSPEIKAYLMCWVFSQTVSVTSLQCSEMLPGPFPARFSSGWWLRGEERRWEPSSLAGPCLALCWSLALWPWHLLPWYSRPGVWVPVGYSLLPCVWLMLHVFTSVSQVRLGWLWQPSALLL